jgi:hypothetical protein
MRSLLALSRLSIPAAVAAAVLAACAQTPVMPQPQAPQAAMPLAAQAPAARPMVKTATWVARDFRFHTGHR